MIVSYKTMNLLWSALSEAILSTTMASATAIVRRAERNLISENQGTITITANWAKSLLYRKNFVKWRGSTAMKMTPENFDSIKEHFIYDVKL